MVDSINTNVNRLKKALLAEIRKQNIEFAELSDEELQRLLFHHNDGLRLSLTGFMQCKSIFTAYSFEIPETIKTKHRFGLSKLEYPYFFTKRRLVLFSEMDASMVKLCGGVEPFLESCYQFEPY
jgi:hypothetical protein